MCRLDATGPPVTTEDQAAASDVGPKGRHSHRGMIAATAGAPFGIADHPAVPHGTSPHRTGDPVGVVGGESTTRRRSRHPHG
jgi:hypothetical protein